MRKRAHRGLERGFALLIATVLSSIALAVGLAVTDVVYRQVVLSSAAKQSQYAFYAADSALECALYFDQQEGTFAYQASPPEDVSISCAASGGAVPVSFVVSEPSADTLRFSSDWFSASAPPACARLTVLKESTGAADIFAEGANTCDLSSTRAIERGVRVNY
ncbi:MAG TPA: hypothetical protein VJB97_01185 [Candidatus Paceibacterota bacterium]